SRPRPGSFAREVEDYPERRLMFAAPRVRRGGVIDRLGQGRDIQFLEADLVHAGFGHPIEVRLQGSAIFDRPLLQNADPPQLEASQLASMSGPGVRDGLAGSVETHDRGISRAIVMMTRDGQNGETRLVEARECGHSLALGASGPRVA